MDDGSCNRATYITSINNRFITPIIVGEITLKKKLAPKLERKNKWGPDWRGALVLPPADVS